MKMLDRWVENSKPFKQLTTQLQDLDNQHRELHARYIALLVYAANIKGAADVDESSVHKTISRLALHAIVNGEDGPPFAVPVSKRLVELAHNIATGKYPGPQVSAEEAFGLSPDGTLSTKSGH